MFEFKLEKITKLGNITILTGTSKDGSFYSGVISDGIKKINVSYGVTTNPDDKVDLKIISGTIDEKDIGKIFKQIDL